MRSLATSQHSECTTRLRPPSDATSNVAPTSRLSFQSWILPSVDPDASPTPGMACSAVTAPLWDLMARTQLRPSHTRRWPETTPETTGSGVPTAATHSTGCLVARLPMRPRCRRNTLAPRLDQKWMWSTPHVENDASSSHRQSRMGTSVATAVKTADRVRHSYTATHRSAPAPPAPDTDASSSPLGEKSTHVTAWRWKPRSVAAVPIDRAFHTRIFGRGPTWPVATRVGPDGILCTRRHVTTSEWPLAGGGGVGEGWGEHGRGNLRAAHGAGTANKKRARNGKPNAPLTKRCFLPLMSYTTPSDPAGKAISPAPTYATCWRPAAFIP